LPNDWEAEIIAWAKGDGLAHQLNGADLGSGKGRTLLEALAFLAEKRRKQRKRFIKDRRKEHSGASVHEDVTGAADFAPRPSHDQDMPDPGNGRHRTRSVFHARMHLGKMFRARCQFVVSIGEVSISFVPVLCLICVASQRPPETSRMPSPHQSRRWRECLVNWCGCT
jgi:hypothetical protein